MSKATTTQTNNRLAQAHSPYLRQHANNPVAWHPWDDEALTLARQQDKPILLSIGYSACHWCHVMAHESFEDPVTAAIMNEYFVNIKVDREERPDLDKIYQLSHQLLVQQGGGWPLTIFMTPDDHLPFFSGTYFPPVARYGMPGFKELLLHIATFFRDHRLEIKQQNKELASVLQQMASAPKNIQDIVLNDRPIQMAQQTLAANFDWENGGFGGAPKFPHPPYLEFLLYCAMRNHEYHSAQIQAEHSGAENQLKSKHTKNQLQKNAVTDQTEQISTSDQPDDHQLEHMLTFTLSKMAESGIYDQLAGGFFRYCVDEHWQIPHFEKMLYDNALLLPLYAQISVLHRQLPAHQPVTDFATTAIATGHWIMRDMQDPAGGYYATLDADSEGHEGKYYVWQTEQLQNILTAEEYAVIATYFNLNKAANFEGQWHFHREQSLTKVALQLKQAESHVQKIYEQARHKLLTVRYKRVSPHRDEKILTSWNGLMIRGMAIAGRYTGHAKLITSAEQAVDFLFRKVWHDNRLLACYKDGQAYQMAYLDDYAFLIDGLLTLLSCQWRSQDLQWAIALTETLLFYFVDDEVGNFFFTAHDHEPLIQKPKSLSDEALPAGNSVAIRILLCLGYLLGETRYVTAAERALRATWPELIVHPQQYAALLSALDSYLHPPRIIILRGAKPDLITWQNALQESYNPPQFVFAVPNDATNLPSAIMNKIAPSSGVYAYVCQGFHCEPVINDLKNLINFLT